MQIFSLSFDVEDANVFSNDANTLFTGIESVQFKTAISFLLKTNSLSVDFPFCIFHCELLNTELFTMN